MVSLKSGIRKPTATSGLQCLEHRKTAGRFAKIATGLTRETQPESNCLVFQIGLT